MCYFHSSSCFCFFCTFCALGNVVKKNAGKRNDTSCCGVKGTCTWIGGLNPEPHFARQFEWYKGEIAESAFAPLAFTVREKDKDYFRVLGDVHGDCVALIKGSDVCVT